jgi:hypothetical protein
MCRMIAFSSKEEIEALPYFERLRWMAKCGKRSPHPDGWGFFCVSQEQILYHGIIKTKFLSFLILIPSIVETSPWASSKNFLIKIPFLELGVGIFV